MESEREIGITKPWEWGVIYILTVYKNDSDKQGECQSSATCCNK